jgi:hypothetical protein
LYRVSIAGTERPSQPKPLSVLIKILHACVRQWRTINSWNSSNRTSFEKQVNKLLSDDEFALFQGFLFSNPKAGAVIQQTGALRKACRAVQGKDKSGGVRVIYFYVTAAAQIRLIAITRRASRTI